MDDALAKPSEQPFAAIDTGVAPKLGIPDLPSSAPTIHDDKRKDLVVESEAPQGGASGAVAEDDGA